MSIIIKGGVKDLRKAIQLFFLLLGGGLGYQFGPDLFLALDPLLNIGIVPLAPYIGAAIGAIVVLFSTAWLVDYIVRFIHWGEETLVKLPVADILFGVMGMILGLIVAFFVISNYYKYPDCRLLSPDFCIRTVRVSRISSRF